MGEGWGLPLRRQGMVVMNPAIPKLPLDNPTLHPYNQNKLSLTPKPN